MSLPVVLHDVASELQLVDDASYAYLNRRTGETIIVTDDEIRKVEDQVDLNALPEWERKILPKVREILESEDWLELPSKWEIHDYRIMERFCYSVDRDEVREQLLQAISGRGAFRYFRNTAERLGIMDAWYAFRDRAYDEIASAWLEEHDIPFVREAGTRASMSESHDARARR